MRVSNIFRLVVVLFFAFNIVSCAQGENTRESVSPAKDLKSYAFDPESPLMSRLQPIPGFVLGHLKEMDKDNTYSSYSTSEKETALLAEYINKLPALHRKVLQDRLLGIYFVQNFQGSGMAEYVLNEKYDVYTILVINPVVLKNDISKQLTYRENTCFARDNTELRIEVNSGSDFRGLMYILLHETTHIADYVMNFTPYVEDELAKIKRTMTRSTDFVKGIWTDYSKASEQYDYPLRDKVTFYGLNKGPRINISDALDLYRQISNTPFVSVYASQNWAEDFADFVTFYHLTQKLKQPYEIRYYKGRELIFRYEPMKAPKVMERFPLMKGIY